MEPLRPESRRTIGIRQFGDHLRNKFVAGLFLVIPLVVTYLVLRLIFNFTLGLLQPLLDRTWFDFLPHAAKPWIALATIIIVLYVAGVITTTVLGHRIARMWHEQVERLPVIRYIYRTTRMATETMDFNNPNNNKKFNRVVLIDYPRPGVKSIGLVTAKLKGTNGEPMVAVYIPTSPTPNSGYLAIVNEADVTTIDMPIDETMKVILTAGILSPESLNEIPNHKPPAEDPESGGNGNKAGV